MVLLNCEFGISSVNVKLCVFERVRPGQTSVRKFETAYEQKGQEEASQHKREGRVRPKWRPISNAIFYSIRSLYKLSTTLTTGSEREIA